MRQITLAGAIATVLMVAAFGCGKQEPQDNAQSKSEQDRDQFVKSMQDTVDSLEANMNKLGALASAKGAEAKAKYDAEVKPALEEKIEQTRVVLAKVKTQSGAVWEGMKSVAQSSVDGLKASYDQAAKMFE